MKYVSLILVMLLSFFASCKDGEETPETYLFIEINNKLRVFRSLGFLDID